MSWGNVDDAYQIEKNGVVLNTVVNNNKTHAKSLTLIGYNILGASCNLLVEQKKSK